MICYDHRSWLSRFTFIVLYLSQFSAHQETEHRRCVSRHVGACHGRHEGGLALLLTLLMGRISSYVSVRPCPSLRRPYSTQVMMVFISLAGRGGVRGDCYGDYMITL